MDQPANHIPRPNPGSKCHTIAVVTHGGWREAATSMVDQQRSTSLFAEQGYDPEASHLKSAA
jgi:hypothetical protein